MKHILITGSAGFIGSNFVPYFLDKYNDYFLVSLDALTYAGNADNLKEVHGHARHKFIEGDICDAELVRDIFSRYDIRGVIHFAAESHVDNSIANPDVFIKTNVNGTFSLLDIACKYWMQKPFAYRNGYEGCRFHHISTDEVYGSLGEDGLFTEMSPYAPNSPYSASKAASDMLVRSYYHTYGLNTVITNCSNNYGPKQHHEKLIPTIIRNAISNKSIPIYGDGSNVRDWLYVLDHCSGVDAVYHNGVSGETYNIGGSDEKTNNEIAKNICLMLDGLHPRGDGKSYTKQITYVSDRPGHDKRYAIDATKIKNRLGWEPQETFESGIIKTINYYLAVYNIEYDVIKNSPKVSIITVVYNGEKHLEETIGSVINQTYGNVEYVIIDGGSTDGTVDIIRRYEDKISYWVSGRDGGISDAFNKGVAASKGDYIYFLGADDYFLYANSIEQMMDKVCSGKDTLVCGNVVRVDMDGKPFSKTDVLGFKKRDLLFRMALPHQGLFMHRRFFDRYGLFDVENKFSMDYELLLRAYSHFPNVLTKDIEVAAWRDGGCGVGRFLEIFDEYHKNRVRNMVAPKFVLDIIHLWTIAKFYIKRAIGKKI